MYTCSMFASYTSYLSRELEKTDSDLASDRKPSNMSKKDRSEERRVGKECPV